MTDLHQEIQSRIDYFKQLCKDRQFIDQESWHFYRGSAIALETLLSYMERGINYDSLIDSEDPCTADLAKKIKEYKEVKSRLLSEATRKKF